MEMTYPSQPNECGKGIFVVICDSRISDNNKIGSVIRMLSFSLIALFSIYILIIKLTTEARAKVGYRSSVSLSGYILTFRLVTSGMVTRRIARLQHSTGL